MLTPRYSKIHPFRSEHSRTGYLGWLLTLKIVYRVVCFDAMSLAFLRDNSVEAHDFCKVENMFYCTM